ncbi:hypothetical protein Zmor_027393 [Zophobas morio]|uniref:Thioesterase domain-containing protein n=1 Tax=Zophobas morio TaxID=2755281 RepID=A0AA38HQG4_9CUCU|nr:hypothetical protein Zmor_027393 [Zophobas morio]
MSGVLKDVAGLLKFIKGRKSFGRVIHKMQILSVGNGKCSVELKIEDEHVNTMGFLHTGLTSTLMDCISGFALMTKVPNTHVSTDMHISCLKPVLRGDTLLIDGWVQKSAKTLAFLEVEMRDKVSGEAVVRGIHTKYILDDLFLI